MPLSKLLCGSLILYGALCGSLKLHGAFCGSLVLLELQNAGGRDWWTLKLARDCAFSARGRLRVAALGGIATVRLARVQLHV